MELLTPSDAEHLNQLAQQYRAAYAQTSPFPHVVIDDFLPVAWLEKVLDEFPSAATNEWRRFDSGLEKKLATSAELQMGTATRLLLYQLNSATFIHFLEQLTSIEGLVPDPDFVGGGLHQIERGGYLKVHADFNWHQKLKLDRRLNLLIYLNKNWKEEYGGHLELWDGAMTRCEKKILPIFNRCVVFNTTDHSSHGHPEPLNCPETMTRKSLALYYYTNGRPAEEISAAHSTLFQARPGEVLPRTAARTSNKTLLKKLIPPILVDLKDALTRRR
jgi:Rps23 Pro-64 3,4-dihydroxylase Tpa1-like proline 4-hydroxylase